MNLIFVLLCVIIIIVLLLLLFETYILLNISNKMINTNIYILFTILVIFLLLCLLYIKYNKSTILINLNKNKENFRQQGGRRRVSNRVRKELLKKCGLPDIPETSHCFNDSTHHTCCELGNKTRDYADSSGNPIGTASKNAFKKLHGRDPTSSDKTSWCTCFGSEVCSTYSDMHGAQDGTNIKFIFNPGTSDTVVKNPKKQCEGFYRDNFKVLSHRTPGVKRRNFNGNKKGNKKCSVDRNKMVSVFNL